MKVLTWDIIGQTEKDHKFHHNPCHEQDTHLTKNYNQYEIKLTKLKNTKPRGLSLLPNYRDGSPWQYSWLSRPVKVLT
jgi:hypothetical protein